MTEVTMPETDSSNTLHVDDLVPVFRASDKDDQSENYGLIAQQFGDLMPEYRAQEITFTIAAGALSTAEADRTLSTSGTRFESPILAWLKCHAQVTSAGTTTNWYLRGQYQGRTDPNGSTGAKRSWYYARQMGANVERVATSSSSNLDFEYFLGSNRIPATAAGGWRLAINPSTLVMTATEDGTAPRQAYSIVAQIAYCLV